MELGPETKLSRGVVRRVWGFAPPYRRHSLAFLGRPLINDAIPRRSLRLIDLIGLAAIGIALANAGLSLTQRWFSARIGEGLIFDLRTALFDHVQRQPQ